MAIQLNEVELSFRSIASELERPVHVTNARDGRDRLFIVEQEGRIRIVQNGQLLSTPFLNIASRISSRGEQGLLSVAFPPDYANKNYFYVNYTNRDGDTVIARYRTTGDPNVADANSEEILLTIDQPFSNHNGGQIAFGADGYLYIGMGDGGSGGDPQNNAQRPGTLLGKMLRIDVESGTQPYTIPDTNPFLANTDPNNRYPDEIWAVGLRNPWRFSFDRQTGDLYIGDVGQSAREEINFQPANSSGGENYGWRILEGSLFFDGQTGNLSDFVLPIAEYERSQGSSVTGGYVYRGTDAELQGVYLYGDFVSGRIWGLQRNGNTPENVLLEDTSYNISTFGEDEAGNLYVADYGGTVYAINRTATSSVPPGVVGNPSNDGLTGTSGNDILTGTANADTITGLAGRDRLNGLGGNDALIGGGGVDRLFGNGGADVLTGDGGSDLLTGGAGRDRFVLQRRVGRDRILDFQDGRDQLGLSGNLQFNTLDILQQGNNTLIRVGNQAIALLEGVNANQLQRRDFVQV
jgi:glucose/arabinose dehydrogenase